MDPTDVCERGRCRQLDPGVFYKDGATRNATRATTATEQIGGTVADIAYFLTIGFASNLGAPPPGSHTNLHGWLERVGARPGIGR